MLSPASHHRLVARDLAGNLAQRKRLLQAAATDRSVQKQLVRMCREDILFYVNFAVWQYNPRAVPRVSPFVLWPFQEEAIIETVRLWIGDEKDMVWEKSRELGATWLALVISDWMCLFHEWEKFLVMSHTEDAVNRPEDPDSLFWKLDFMHARLPAWLARGVQRRKHVITFPATNSTITAAATTERSGIGGRGKVLLDEFSKHRAAREILAQTYDTGPRLFIGTHYGAETTFNELARRPDIHKIVMHWSQHPKKCPGLYRPDPKRPTLPLILDKSYQFPEDYRFILDGAPTGGPHPGLRSPWYDEECRKRNDSRDVAMHLDIDPQASAKQFFDPVRIYKLIADAREPVWEGEFEADVYGHKIEMREEKGGRLRLWVRPDGFGNLPVAQYTGGADVSGGTGATNSCLSLIDADRGLVVGEWADPRTEEREFAQLCAAVCRWLKDKNGSGAYFVWDACGQNGTKFSNEMTFLGYSNIYYDQTSSTASSRKAKPTIARTRRPGFYARPETKYAAIKDYRNAIYDGRLADRSERCLKETLRIEYDKNTAEIQHAERDTIRDPTGAKKNHSDLVTSRWLAYMLVVDGNQSRGSPNAAGVQPGTLEWIMALHDQRLRRLEEVY